MAQRHDIVMSGHFAAQVVQRLVLHEDHRIVIADRGEQHALGIVRVGRHRHFQPRHRCQHRVRALAVLRRCVHASAISHADHQRAACAPAKHIAELGHLIPDLVHADPDEIGKHQLCNHALPGQRRARRCTDNRAFRYRRVDHPFCAIFGIEAGGRTPDAAHRFRPACRAHTANHILTQHDQVRVAFHFFMQGKIDRLAHHHNGHRKTPINS